MKEILDNVSLFWSKYFKDSDILHSLIEGAVSAVANLKQDQYAYLLSTGLDSVPLEVRKENYLLQLQDSKFLSVTVDTGQTFLVYDFEEDFDLRCLPLLMPSPYSETFLEDKQDYLFFSGDSAEINSSLKQQLEPTHTYLQFSKDPRVPGNFPNVTFRKEPEYIQGNYVIEGIGSSIVIEPNTEVEILDSNHNVLQKCRVALHDSLGDLYLSISTPLKLVSNSRYVRKLNAQEAYEISGVREFIYPDNVLQAWVPAVRVDTNLLGLLYGHIHTATFSKSTEQYRNFLLGLYSLRTKPFSLSNIKSSLCLCANVPVFTTSYEDGDRIIRVDYGMNFTTVFTTLATYRIPASLTIDSRIENDAIEISRFDITETNRGPHHVQTFFFEELQPLVTDIQVKTGNDADRSWWDRDISSSNFIEVPQGVMPGESLKRRTVINCSYPNNIGEVEVTVAPKTYLLPSASIGDYGISIGQAERNTIAYNLFNDFIRHHTVFIEVSQEFLDLQVFTDQPEILEDYKSTLEKVCIPGTLVILDSQMNADLEDVDSDGIPDIIDPDPTTP